MKKLLLAGAATALLTTAAAAADLPRRAAPPVFVPPPVFTWSGVYIGTHTAYTFVNRQRFDTFGTDALTRLAVSTGVIPGSVRGRSLDGFANFGGGFGVNYQLTPGSGFVLGAALDADWTNLDRNTIAFGVPIFGLQTANRYTSELGWLATANGRLGYAFDRFLVYGTGGAAIGHVKYGQYVSVLGGPVALNGGGGDGANEVGYNFGGGIEYALPTDSFLSNLNVLKLLGINLGGTTTIKAEYIHYNLGRRTFSINDTDGVTPTGLFTRVKTEGSMVRAGFSYKFP